MSVSEPTRPRGAGDAEVGFVPLEGGHSGETFLAEVGGERTVVRIFAAERHPVDAARIQASVLRLVRGLLPVPVVKEARRADAATGAPALLVTEFLPGVRGDLMLEELVAAGAVSRLRALGESVGAVAATLAAMPTLTAGLWADGELRLTPFDGGLGGWVARHRPALAATGWSEAELDGLAEVAEAAQDLLDTVDRTCVVHGDLNPKNLLVDPGTLAVTGVVDWEFCHAGHPFTDLGNVLRFDREPAYVEGVVGAWIARHGGQCDAVLALARSADLTALVDLAVRAGANPVADRAAALLREIVRSGDLGALPAAGGGL